MNPWVSFFLGVWLGAFLMTMFFVVAWAKGRFTMNERPDDIGCADQ